MEKETSNNPSTTPKVELDKTTSTATTTTSASAVAASTNGSGVITPQYLDPNQSLVTTAQLQNVEERLNTQIVKHAGGKTGLLWLVAVIALAAGGFGSYTAFMQQQKLSALDSSYQTTQTEYLANKNHFETALRDIDAAKQQVEAKTAELNNVLDQLHTLQQEHQTLSTNDQNLGAVISSLQNTYAQLNGQITKLNADLSVLQERNPQDWLLSESFFLVKNAYQKAVFEKDVDSAIWMLTNADELLVNIEDEQVINIREAISKDLMTLKNIHQIDFRGLGLDLDRAYDNVDKLIFNGYSDKQTVFQKNAAPTEDIANWKENLLTSAKEFSNRFIEIRRRDANAVNEFLTPEQELYVRENIKTRILLAKNDLSHGDKAEMQSNLNQAINLIKAYCDQDSEITKSTLDYLSKLAQSEITIETPKLLESYKTFTGYAQEHLLGRGK